MDLTFSKQTVRFLADAQEYSCDLPTTLDLGHVELSTVISYVGRSRSLVYSVMGDPDLETTHTLTRTADAAGIPVSIYRLNEPPPLLTAFWRLGDDRFLSTSMPDTDGDPSAPGQAGLDDVMKDVDIAWAAGYPLISLRGTVQPPDMREPRYRDEIALTRANGAGPIVRMRREPPWVRASEAVTVAPASPAEPEYFEAWAVTRSQIRISCFGPSEQSAELEAAATRIAASFSVS